MTNWWSWYYAFFGIHYLPFVIPAAAVFVLRLALRRVSRRELALLGLVLLMLLLEAVQLMASHANLERGNVDFMVTWERYFGVLAPLLWSWAAVGVVQLLDWSGRNWLLKSASYFVIVGALFVVLVHESVSNRYDEIVKGSGRDAMVAGERIARFIARDYTGPRRFENFPYQIADYYTSRRPVVVSFWGCAAWACRGQSQGVMQGGYPMREDYLFARVDRRFVKEGLGRGLERSPEHEFVHEVRGTKFRWRLYRRKEQNKEVR